MRRETATMLATCLHLMQGTPFIYQGEEIGMTNMPFDRIAHYRDLESLNGYAELVENQGLAPEAALAKVQYRSRDNARTPMQWDASPGAGFTTGTPWLAINPNHTGINVAAEENDPASVLNYYKRLIALRQAHDVMVYGRYDLIAETDPRLYAFTRTDETTRLMVLCNFAGEAVVFHPPEAVGLALGEWLIGNYPEATDDFQLRPYEARVYRL